MSNKKTKTPKERKAEEVEDSELSMEELEKAAGGVIFSGGGAGGTGGGVLSGDPENDDDPRIP